jgi:predicted dehydrogenase
MLQVACIGVGGMGGATMKAVAAHPKVKIVALCDVDDKSLDQAAKAFPDSSRHKDWRELLGRRASAFDAVTIGTPDHMHAAPAVTAIRAKKHLYLQKPMASTLHECRVITQEAAKAGVVTQLGNQGRSSVESRMTVELIRSGTIGKIKEVILWENKDLVWWPKNTELRVPGDPLPAGLDWDLWLGVRQPRPYLANTYHPHTWRAWFDFGTGEMGDMGCHARQQRTVMGPAPYRRTHLPGNTRHGDGYREIDLVRRRSASPRQPHCPAERHPPTARLRHILDWRAGRDFQELPRRPAVRASRGEFPAGEVPASQGPRPLS